jgi:hypothetical protein
VDAALTTTAAPTPDPGPSSAALPSSFAAPDSFERGAAAAALAAALAGVCRNDVSREALSDSSMTSMTASTSSLPRPDASCAALPPPPPPPCIDVCICMRTPTSAKKCPALRASMALGDSDSRWCRKNSLALSDTGASSALTSSLLARLRCIDTKQVHIHISGCPKWRVKSSHPTHRAQSTRTESRYHTYRAECRA